jgi:hypothetical protein
VREIVDKLFIRTKLGRLLGKTYEIAIGCFKLISISSTI